MEMLKWAEGHTSYIMLLEDVSSIIFGYLKVQEV